MQFLPWPPTVEQHQLASDIAKAIKDGNIAAWEVSEQKNAALMKRVGHSVTLPKDIAKNVKQSSETALEEFVNSTSKCKIT